MKNNNFLNLERCARCVLPITWETLALDKNGVCNICHNWEQKKDNVNWKEREKEFIRIVNDVKKKKLEYDCIVPFSGGKDSTFTLIALVKRFKLKPLVVSFDHGFYRPKTLDNRTRTFRKLGVDVITFTPNWAALPNALSRYSPIFPSLATLPVSRILAGKKLLHASHFRPDESTFSFKERNSLSFKSTICASGNST